MAILDYLIGLYQQKGCSKQFHKMLCRSLFFNQVDGLKPATLLKKITWHMFISNSTSRERESSSEQMTEILLKRKPLELLLISR